MENVFVRGRSRSPRWALTLILSAAMCPSWVLVAQDEVAPAEEEEEEAGPNTGAVSLSAGVDVASAYYYRGIPQEDQGVITQPWMEIGFNLFTPEEGQDSGIDSLDLAFGSWNSLHDNTSGNPWYESDFYASLSAGLGGFLSASVGYTYLHSPNLGDFFSEELALGNKADDSNLFGGEFGFAPFATLIFELDGGSDGLGDGGDEGILLELGVAPSFTADVRDLPVTLGLGVKVALNLGDYYETASGEDDDETFGYLDIYPNVSIPLPLPARYGSWSFGGGVHFLVLGDSAAEIGDADFGVSDGDTFEVYTNWGITIEY